MTRIHSFCVLACLYLISNNDYYISTTANDRFEPGRLDENSSLIDRSKNEPIVYNACVTSFYFPHLRVGLIQEWDCQITSSWKNLWSFLHFHLFIHVVYFDCTFQTNHNIIIVFV